MFVHFYKARAAAVPNNTYLVVLQRIHQSTIRMGRTLTADGSSSRQMTGRGYCVQTGKEVNSTTLLRSLTEYVLYARSQ